MQSNVDLLIFKNYNKYYVIILYLMNIMQSSSNLSRWLNNLLVYLHTIWFNKILIF